MEPLIVATVVVALVVMVIAKTAIVVGQQNAYVVEYLGKFDIRALTEPPGHCQVDEKRVFTRLVPVDRWHSR